MTESLKEQIRKNYANFTDGQQAVAKFILIDPKMLALYSAKKIGQLTGTSETTVIRLCYALGYSGYSALQTEIREELVSVSAGAGPLEMYRNITGELISSGSDLLQKIMEQDIAFIQELYRTFDQEIYHKAIAGIIEAKKVVAVGFRSSFAPASWLAFYLNIIKGDTYLYKGPLDDAISLLAEMKEDWLVIAFSFPRYASETISFVQAARARKAKILAFTDDELSPLGAEADLLWKVITAQPSGFNGMTTIFSLLKALVTGLEKANWEAIQERIRNYNEHSLEFYGLHHNE